MFFKPKFVFALVVLVLCLVPFNEVYGKPQRNSFRDFEFNEPRSEPNQYEPEDYQPNRPPSSDRSQSDPFESDSQPRGFQTFPLFLGFPTIPPFSRFPTFPTFPPFPRFPSGGMGQDCSNRKFGCNSGSCWETCDTSSSGPTFQSNSKRYRSSTSSCSTDNDCQSF